MALEYPGTLIRSGSTGDDVVDLQQFLIDNGYDLDEFGADGDFGGETSAALKAYQKDQGITADGVAGPVTYGTMTAVADTTDDTAVTEDVEPVGTATGTAEDFPGIMPGGTLVRVTRENGDDMFIQSYEYPPGSGEFIAWQYESWEQVQQTFGNDQTFDSVPEGDRNNYTIVGDSSIISGEKNSFSTLVSETMLEATQGVSPGLANAILNDSDMQAIVVQGALGGWDADRIRAEQRRTNYWKNVLYPGIGEFYNLTSQPERAWLDYSANVESNLVALGYERDADGSFRSSIGSMLTSGIDDETFNTMSPVFLRAESSTDYYNALNQWSVQDLGRELDFDSWFSLMDGTAEQDLTLLAERATFQFVADNAGSNITADQIRQITSDFDYSEAQLGTIVGDFESTMTALAGRALGKYDLTADDVLALKSGSDAASGRSHEDIRVKALQAAREEGLADNEKAGLFTDYIAGRGTPVRPGLFSANPLS